MRIDVGVLGPIQAARDGQVIDVGGPQRRRLLAFLCCDPGHVVPVERVVERDVARRWGAGWGRSHRDDVRLAPARRGCSGDHHVARCRLRGRPGARRAGQPAVRGVGETGRDRRVGARRGDPRRGAGSVAGRGVRRVRRRVVGDRRGDPTRRAARVGTRGAARPCSSRWAVRRRRCRTWRRCSSSSPAREGLPVGMLMHGFGRRAGRRTRCVHIRAHRRRLPRRAASTRRPGWSSSSGRSLGDEVAPLASAADRCAATCSRTIWRGRPRHACTRRRQPGTEPRRSRSRSIRAELADAPDFVRHFELEAQPSPVSSTRTSCRCTTSGANRAAPTWCSGCCAAAPSTSPSIAGGRSSLDTAGRLVEQVGAAMIAAHASACPR